MKKVLLVVLLLCKTSTFWHTAAAESKDLIFSRWAEDAGSLRTRVINPMNEAYAKKEGPIAWHVYSSELLTRIRPLRGELQPYSYDFVRKLILSLNETYSGKSDQYNWEDAAQFVDVQLHFVGDIITGVVEQIDGFQELLSLKLGMVLLVGQIPVTIETELLGHTTSKDIQV